MKYNRAEAMKLYGETQDKTFKEMQEQNILFELFKGANK